jgi:thioredoxin-dependent peroxiredoxin
MLKAGDKAPAFRATADDGKTVSLSDYEGKDLVLYFYPKANTSGCTHEAMEFSSALDDFAKLNTDVVGVSGDSIESQTKFKNRYKIKFPLLADTEFDVIEPFGARRMKTFFGKSFLGIVRMTFWIGPDGIIKKVWEKVTPKGHAAEVLAEIRSGEPAAAK